MLLKGTVSDRSGMTVSGTFMSTPGAVEGAFSVEHTDILIWTHDENGKELKDDNGYYPLGGSLAGLSWNLTPVA